MPTISDISESESSHHMVPQPGVTPRRSIFDEEQNRFVEMAPAAAADDDDGHDADTVYADTCTRGTYILESSSYVWLS